jgi:hypothetical protein
MMVTGAIHTTTTHDCVVGYKTPTKQHKAAQSSTKQHKATQSNTKQRHRKLSTEFTKTTAQLPTLVQRTQTMGDCDHGGVLERCSNSALDFGVGLQVHIGSGLVPARKTGTAAVEQARGEAEWAKKLS